MTSEPGSTLEAQARLRHAEGDYEAALSIYEAAFTQYQAEGDLGAAARAARTVGWFRGWVFGEWAMYQGWTARAVSLLERAGDARAEGWLRYEAARQGNDLETQRRLYVQAIEAAQRTADADLECEATASLGMMLVFSGLVDDGMVHLDHALAAICGGDVHELPVVEGCLCGLLNACERTHDVQRGEEWLGAADEVMRRGNLLAVAGYCRAHYAGILMTAGRWNDAEAELTRALDLLTARTAVRESALCRLADLRLRQGRPEEAALLLEGLEHHEDAVLPLAALHAAQGHPELALELLDRVLAPGGLPDYAEAPLPCCRWTVRLRGAMSAARDATRNASPRWRATSGRRSSRHSPRWRGDACASPVETAMRERAGIRRCRCTRRPVCPWRSRAPVSSSLACSPTTARPWRSPKPPPRSMRWTSSAPPGARTPPPRSCAGSARRPAPARSATRSSPSAKRRCSVSSATVSRTLRSARASTSA